MKASSLRIGTHIPARAAQRFDLQTTLLFVCLLVPLVGWAWPTISMQGAVERPGTPPTIALSGAHTDWLLPARTSQAYGGAVTLQAAKAGTDLLTLSAGSAGWTTWDPSGLYAVTFADTELGPSEVGIGTPGENHQLFASVDLRGYASATVTLYSGRECPPGYSPKVYCQGRIRGDWGSYTNEVWAQLPYLLQVADIGLEHEPIIFIVEASDFEEIENPVLEVIIYAQGGASSSVKLTAITLHAVEEPPSLGLAPNASGLFGLSFATEPGKTYTLQSSSNLCNPGAWSNVWDWTDITGDGSVMTASPPVQVHGCIRLLVNDPE